MNNMIVAINCALKDELRNIILNKKFTSYYRQIALQEHYDRGNNIRKQKHSKEN